MALFKNISIKYFRFPIIFLTFFIGCSEDIVDPSPPIENEFTEKAKEFLYNNNFNIELMNDTTFSAIPDSVINSNEIIFTGENHAWCV